MKKLAIQGHSTRGKEVIELLEMMGGKNSNGFICSSPNRFYYILNEYFCLDYIDSEEINEYVIFTLEEFLEKYLFKVDDKVVDGYGNLLTIKSMNWHDGFETVIYNFKETEVVLCAEDLEAVNDNNTKPTKMKNVLAELLDHIKTTPKDELEREFKEIESEGWTNVGPTVEEFMDFCNKVNKKPEYPKTYEDCCFFLHEYPTQPDITGYKYELLHNFRKLLVCRDAYWKIAGEQMGLSKLWKPNWTTFEGMPAIFRFRYNIVCDSIKNQHCLLVFPTEEMRDAFYENFKDLIEECKELL